MQFRFRTVRGIQATGLTVEPANPASPGDSGRIVITFSRPLAPNVVLRTNGPGANCALIAAQPSSPTSAADVEAARRDANAGLPPFASTNPFSQRRVKTYIDGTDSTRIDSVGTISADRRSVSFRYFYLPTTPPAHRFIAFVPAIDNGGNAAPDIFARDISRGADTSSALNIATIPSAIRSELPGDYGIGGPVTHYANRIDFPVNITPPPPPVPPPVFVVATSVTPANQLSYTDSVVTITFSRSMNKSTFTSYTVEQLTNTLGDANTVNITGDIDTVWNGDATQIAIRRKRYSTTTGDSVKPFLAGAVYRITFGGSPQAADGGTLRGFTGLAFRMEPRTRIVDARVAFRSNRNDAATVANFTTARSLFTGTADYAVADTVGEIRLVFSRPVVGNYHTRGSATNSVELIFGLRDTTGRQGGTATISSQGAAATDELSARNIGRFLASQDGGEVAFGQPSASATIDCVGTIFGNELRFKYYVSRHLLGARGLLVGNNVQIGVGGVGTGPVNQAGATNFVVQLVPAFAAAVDSSAPLAIRTSGERNTLASTTDPKTIRSAVRGDLGVVRLNANLDSKFSGSGDRGTRFDIKFGVTSDGGTSVPQPSAIPDMVVSAVRNAVETVGEFTQRTVSTVRSWWKRFRGE
ncbi:MAG: hypothetical protein RML35_05410 [Chloroherpetonaceae bacterium]|nr:hypothetical protein [Chloroherpetonaceae bacterium]